MFFYESGIFEGFRVNRAEGKSYIPGRNASDKD